MRDNGQRGSCESRRWGSWGGAGPRGASDAAVVGEVVGTGAVAAVVGDAVGAAIGGGAVGAGEIGTGVVGDRVGEALGVVAGGSCFLEGLLFFCLFFFSEVLSLVGGGAESSLSGARSSYVLASSSRDSSTFQYNTHAADRQSTNGRVSSRARRQRKKGTPVGLGGPASSSPRHISSHPGQWLLSDAAQKKGTPVVGVVYRAQGPSYRAAGRTGLELAYTTVKTCEPTHRCVDRQRHRENSADREGSSQRSGRLSPSSAQRSARSEDSRTHPSSEVVSSSVSCVSRAGRSDTRIATLGASE
eukprot:9405497-Pyramimonas_sp.AAC.1